MSWRRRQLHVRNLNVPNADKATKLLYTYWVFRCARVRQKQSLSRHTFTAVTNF